MAMHLSLDPIRKMKKLAFLVMAMVWGCTNIMDAPRENRNSFVFFYPAKQNTLGISAAPDADGGVVMTGFRTESLNDITKPTMVLIKTDAKGKPLFEQEYPVLPDTSYLYGKAVKPVDGGYLVGADNIKVTTDENSNQVTVTKIYLYKMDAAGNVTFQYKHKPNNTISYTTNSITLDDLGNVVLLGTKGSALNRQSLILIFAPSGTGYNVVWDQEFDLQTKSYTNAKSVQLTPQKNVIWASSITQGLTAKSYVAFPTVAPGSTFINSRLIGENDDVNNILVSDLQKNPFGFASVGVNYTIVSGTTTSNNNFFFARLANDGNVLATNYYDDGALIDASDPTNLSKPAFNTLEDGGLAVAPAQDGGFLLVGYLDSRPAVGGLAARGNGGKDVSLIKVDAFGNVQWYKTYGGIGDEVANTAFQAADGGFIITGTSTVQGFASMFVMKVNANGGLDN
ncbi:MAG: hypothetical protein ACK514_16725 [Bacteroidota bacterium]|jgi:hypothetical protein|nr:hypothetical protein [Cytophagales bacterium]